MNHELRDLGGKLREKISRLTPLPNCSQVFLSQKRVEGGSVIASLVAASSMTRKPGGPGPSCSGRLTEVLKVSHFSLLR